MDFVSETIAEENSTDKKLIEADSKDDPPPEKWEAAKGDAEGEGHVGVPTKTSPYPPPLTIPIIGNEVPKSK